MEKATRALIGVEDNTLRIEAIAKRASSVVVTGVASGGTTSFGTLYVDGGAAIIAFDGSACELTFGGKTVASGTSPLFAKLSGSGELKLNAARSNARGIVFGTSTIR